MRIMFKFLIYFIAVILAILFYLLYIPSGTQTLYKYLSHTLSKKVNLNVEIISINIRKYPFIIAEMLIEKRAKLDIHGYIHDYESIDMKYTIKTDCIETTKCIIKDDILITGNIKSDIFEENNSPIKITGEGKALDGHISYSALKFKDKAKDIHISLKDINSSKLFMIFDEKVLFNGRSNAKLDFSLLEKDKKIGTISYTLEDAHFYGFPIFLQSQVNIDEAGQHFNMLLTAPGTKLNITKGKYHAKQQEGHAFYTLDIKDLTPYETLLDYKYRGPLYIVGEAHYTPKGIKIEGLSNTFDGMLNLLYYNNILKMYVDKVSFKKFMSLFEYPIFFDGDTSGTIDYDFVHKLLEIDTKLTKVKLLHTKIVDVIYQKTKINMLTERFDDSSLRASYQNNLLTGDLILRNYFSHLSLTSTQINTQINTINAFFDFKMQKQEFSGKVYGDMDNPKVNLDMQKLIQYQMTKQLDSFMGKQQRENMEDVIQVMPMGDVAKDVATDAAASFMGIFF